MLNLFLFALLFLFIMFLITIINSWMRITHLRKTPRFGIDRWVVVNNLELHFVEFGDGPVLILLPDFLHSYRCWNLLLPTLSKNFKCLALEYPGVGSSERAADFSYTIAHQSWIIQKFIEKLPVEKVHLLGIGYGATLALHLAEYLPSRIDRTVVIEAVRHPAAERPFEAEKILNFLKFPLLGHVIFLLLKSGCFSESYAKRSIPGKWETMSELERLNFQNDLALSFSELSRSSLLELLINWLDPEMIQSNEPKINPILHLIGENSDAYETLKSGISLLKMNPQVTHWIIEDGVHALHWQFPRWLAQVVYHFVTAQDVFDSTETGGVWMVQASE